MAIRLAELVMRWMARGGIDVRLAPDPAVLEAGFPDARISCRPAARSSRDRRLGGSTRLPPARRAPDLAARSPTACIAPAP